MAKLHTTISQWGLISGVRKTHSDMVVVSGPHSPFAPEARKGQLFIVVEAEGDVGRGRQACALVARTICDAFYADGSMSITASLRQALKAANAALYQHNFSAPPHKRALVGVTCAVVHGVDLYVTQAPPAQAFITHGRKLRALPVPLSWTSGANAASLNRQGSLGTSLGSEPEFFRSVLQVGDALVLCSSNIARLIGKQEAEELICYSDAPTIAEDLYNRCRTANLPEAHALVLEALPGPVSAQHDSHNNPVAVESSSANGSRWSGWFRRQGSTPGTATTVAHDSSPVAVVAEASPVANGRAVSPQPQATPPLTVMDTLPVADVLPLPPSAFLGEGEYGGLVRPPAAPRRTRQVDLSDNTGTPVDFAALPRRPAPAPPSLGDRLTMPVRMLLAMVLGGVANVPRRTRRAAEQQPAQGLRLKGLSYKKQRPPLPWLNIVLIVGVVVLLVIFGLQQNRQRDLDLVSHALDKVSTEVRAARRTADGMDAQAKLAEAERVLNNDVVNLVKDGLIAESKPDVWSRYLTVRNEYDRAMALLNRIGFMGELETLATLPGGDGLIERVVVGTSPISTTSPPVFYLDKQAGLLYQQGQSEPLLKPDVEIGPFPVKPIRDALWREENKNVMALDRGDTLFPIYRVYLRDNDNWLANQLNKTEHMEPAEGDLPMAAFGGNLYIWDAKERQLWKYAAGMYADLPVPWIAPGINAPLDKVVDVQVDGRVYLLNRDGSILILEGGNVVKQVPVPQLAVPVSTVARFVVTTDELAEDGTVTRPGFIYMLDTRNERVLQLDKQTGELVQQIQARVRGPLNQLSDLAIDESRRMLYLANGPRVVRTSLPEPPVPSVEETTTATPEP